VRPSIRREEKREESRLGTCPPQPLPRVRGGGSIEAVVGRPVVARLSCDHADIDTCEGNGCEGPARQGASELDPPGLLDLLLYVRELADERLLVALNFGGESVAANFAPDDFADRPLLSSHGDRDDEAMKGTVDLRGH
jgi:hypothetical protein